jgi:hypothetical protein
MLAWSIVSVVFAMEGAHSGKWMWGNIYMALLMSLGLQIPVTEC